jgi:thymidylate synthase (FAD)
MTGESKEIVRAASPELDAILGETFPVLDQGFLRVVDYMGSDAAIVQAARVSYGAGTKKTSEDRALIRYLLRQAHTSPFEMCELKLHIKVPMDCWRQWIRHRTASVNEYSTRYSEAISSMQKTAPNEWRSQAQDNKQGSGDFLEVGVGREMSRLEGDFHDSARRLYETRLAVGVAREQARKDLPLSTYTEAYWKIDLHNLLHFLSLRMDSHAQKEIRAYATTIGEEIVSRWVPHTWEAFLDYRLNNMKLSGLETELLQIVLRKDVQAYNAWVDQHNWVTKGLKVTRELMEFSGKLERLGIELWFL